MGVTFRVDVDQLEQLHQQVKHVSLDLVKASDLKSFYGVDAQSIGSQAALDELSDYITHWKSGRDRVADLLDTLSQLLMLAATTYRTAEQTLTSVAGPATGSTPTSQAIQEVTY